MSGELITKSFVNQCLAFPSRVDEMLAKIETVEEAKDMLDKASAMRHYAEKLKAGLEVERPIALGVLKIKAKVGEMCPPRPPADRGQGRGGKKSTTPAEVDFAPETISAYRKLAEHKDKLEEFYESTEDVPTQTDFLKYVQPCHVSNNSVENEWYTPPDFIERARRTMGGIDLDPASCDEAQKLVKAKRFYTMADDGLTKKWKGRVWMNPPYSKDTCPKFTAKLLEHAAAGDISQACVLVNNATETAWMQPLLWSCAAACFISGRIKFLDKTGQPANSPLQGQAILYFGPNVEMFASEFMDTGTVLFATAIQAAVESVEASSVVADEPDRIAWVIERIGWLWDKYNATFGDRAERHCFIAGLENWQARE